MKFPISWLNDYVDVHDIPANTYAHAMTMSGSKVEGIENSGDEIDRVVVGKLLDVTKHPNADKLSICKVDVGDGVLQIVTGAENIKTGEFVPVALQGAHLPGGIVIKRGKLRGEESNGMLCSMGELNLTKEDVPYADENGILILDQEYPVGTDIKDVFGLDEDVVEFEITPNRPDCFSVIGLARETAVTFDRPFSLKTPVVKEAGGGVCDYAKVTVKDSENCLRYAARVIKNVKIGQSPKWMQDRLRLSGIRSINNIVDITNYVLLEYGQPMHAFNLDKLEGREIVVRRANKGEVMTTLDEQERILDESMLLICDAKAPACIAGVMGGLNTEVEADTKTILFECATFLGTSVRLTAKKLGLRTESSARYEKGLDPQNVLPALNRACELVELLGAGEVVSGIIDVDNSDNTPKVLPFRPDYINRFLGTDIAPAFMVSTLTNFGFSIQGNQVIVPSYRPDIDGEADIAEEVARIYGYNRIESAPLRGETTQGIKTKPQKIRDMVQDALIAQGMYEIMNFSFTSPDVLALLNSGAQNQPMVTITNPLGRDCSVMRTTLLASMLQTIAFNYNQRNASARFYEIANVYFPKENQKLPDELLKVSLGMYGDVDFYDLKGAVESILDALHIRDYEFCPVKTNPTFHPGRCAQVLIGKQPLGVLGEVHPEVLDHFSIGTKAYAAELDFNTLVSAAAFDIQYRPLPKFPAVTRDIALLLSDETGVGEVEKAIAKCAGAIFETVELFDVYKGAQIEEGKKSVAFSVTYRAEDRTLTDEEINHVFEKTVAQLQKQFGAQLR